MCPQREHSCDVPCAGILMVNFSFLSPLYLENVTILPHIELRMDLLRPALALAPLLRNVPLASLFTFGFLTMLETCKSSKMFTCAVSSVMSWLILFMGSVLTNIALLGIGFTDPHLSSLPALRAFALVGEFLLQLLPHLLSVRKRLLFSPGKIVLLAITHGDRDYHPSVDAVHY